MNFFYWREFFQGLNPEKPSLWKLYSFFLLHFFCSFLPSFFPLSSFSPSLPPLSFEIIIGYLWFSCQWDESTSSRRSISRHFSTWNLKAYIAKQGFLAGWPKGREGRNRESHLTLSQLFLQLWNSTEQFPTQHVQVAWELLCLWIQVGKPWN